MQLLAGRTPTWPIIKYTAAVEKYKIVTLMRSYARTDYDYRFRHRKEMVIFQNHVKKTTKIIA